MTTTLLPPRASALPPRAPAAHQALVNEMARRYDDARDIWTGRKLEGRNAAEWSLDQLEEIEVELAGSMPEAERIEWYLCVAG